ncbi:MAG: hypothetical protein Fur0037_11660 [Planctomycetota bacterium]
MPRLQVHRLALFALAFAPALSPAQDRRPLPPLEEATRVFDGSSIEEIAWPSLLDRLSEADVVFLGETHTDDTTHRVELAVLEGLLVRRSGKVVLSMEMFERDVQRAMDDYLRDRITEAEFLARSRPWDNYPTAYRPLIEKAKAAGIPVVAANCPSSVRRRLGMGGKQAFEDLPAPLRSMMPENLFPAGDGYWRRVDRAVRGHMGGMSGRSPEERLYDAQNLWDNAMGDNVARARSEHPDSIVLHVAGGFHVAYRDGTCAQFARRRPGDRVLVVEIAPTPALHFARPDRDAEEADYLIYAETLSRGLWQDTFAVEIPAELRYRLSLPGGVDHPPLLVWLPGRGTRPEDAMAFWEHAIGGEVAVAVVEQPFPEAQDDLAMGGRYALGDGFRADYGRAQHGIERIVEYVTRRFPVDEKRVVIAGEGEGGAVVLWTALYGQWLEHDMVAIDPEDLVRLSMEALPDREPAMRSLRLAAARSSIEPIEKVAADFAEIGARAEAVSIGSDPSAVENELRRAFGLPPRKVFGEPVLLVVESDLQRAIEWAGLMASRLRDEAMNARIVRPGDPAIEASPAMVRRLRIGEGGLWQVSAFEDGSRIPLAGGDFGGTTIVVLPQGLSPRDRDAWKRIEKSGVLNRRGMFASLSVVEMGGEPSLASVLKRLRERRRTRVLIVPALFCADEALMAALKREAAPEAPGLDVHWLPGLGAELLR